MKKDEKNFGLKYKKGVQIIIQRGDHKSKKGTIISCHKSKSIGVPRVQTIPLSNIFLKLLAKQQSGMSKIVPKLF